MSNLLSQIDADLAAALRHHDDVAVSVLRMLKSSLKNEQIKLGHELSADEALKIVQREVKQRQDSIKAYQHGGRQELAAAEAAELTVLERYRPAQMSEADLSALVNEVIAETGATDAKQMGQVIAAVMKLAAGAADGATVSRLVREKLG